jgi:hypothetical protein
MLPRSLDIASPKQAQEKNNKPKILQLPLLLGSPSFTFLTKAGKTMKEEREYQNEEIFFFFA